MKVAKMLSDIVLQTYISDIKTAWEKDKAEANLVSLFSSFIQNVFGIQANAFTLEQTIYMADIKRRGRTDILFGDLVFEFKKNKSFKIADRKQLRNYLIEKNKGGDRYTGLITDGLNFEAYLLDEGKLRLIDSFNLSQMSEKSAFVKLDAYLFSRHSQPPSSQDVVARFGGESPTFRTFEKDLQRLYDRVKSTSMIQTWRLQWQRLLSRVYGSDIADDTLFLRHTYLCQFAKLLGYSALRNLPDTISNVDGIIRGDAFRGLGVKNIGETDFFSWILMPTIKKDAVELFQQLASSLVVYDLAAVDQDLLKQLYQNLVDTQTRQDLGEFYTPDWLVGFVLEDIHYQHPQSLYDPTCGSGSFLFSAIRRLVEQGLKGRELVQFATNNIVGTDVHPLAITIARMNYLLALAEHMKDTRTTTNLINIPIFMADSLLRSPEKKDTQNLSVEVDGEKDEVFVIPFQTTLNEEHLSEMIDHLETFARPSQPNQEAFIKKIQSVSEDQFTSATRRAWANNLQLLARLKTEDRNGIWAYILKNQARPLALAQRKFDVIVGNPPWLTYNAIQSDSYKRDVKRLYKHYSLVASRDSKLFTQMDLSTLFYALVRDRYLKTEGTLAFVMPRSVITGAKQHRLFQQIGFTRILDFENVTSLFNVPTCVLIQQGALLTANIPTRYYEGKLPDLELEREVEFSVAQAYLVSGTRETSFVDSFVRSEYYRESFFQGASLFPRRLCLVKPHILPSSPAVITDTKAKADDRYKNISIIGTVNDEYVYATLLGSQLAPFGYSYLSMTALPVSLEDNNLSLVSTETQFLERGHVDTWDTWFKKVTELWLERRKGSTRLDFYEQINYRNKLISQKPTVNYKTLYATSGSNISSCVIDTKNLPLVVYGRTTQGFIADSSTYWCDISVLEEAHYLCALLNSETINSRIKIYQPRGLYGARHVHRTPFEACAIPPFDPTQEIHQLLAQQSIKAHQELEFLQQSGTAKSVGALRNLARRQAEAQLKAIDRLTQLVLLD